MARRVNSKFLILFSAIVLGGIAAALVIAYPLRGALRSDRARKSIELAERLMTEADKELTVTGKKEKMESAVRSYIQAVSNDSKNPDLYVKLGDAYTKLTLYDVYQYIRASRQAWERALEINPAHLTALRRLQESYYQESQMAAPAQVFALLKEKATNIHKLDPSDRRAHALMYIAPLSQWRRNIETPSVDIDAAVQELTALLDKDPAHPDNADLVYYLAFAKAKRGVESKRAGSDRQANELFAAAINVFQEALKVQDGNAALHFRFAELLEYVRSEDKDRDPTQRYGELVKRELERARELAKPEDPQFVMIHIRAQQYAQAQRQYARAEQILLDAQQVKNDDQRIRLELARLWRSNPQKRLEAIELLKRPITNIGFEGVEARNRVRLEIDTLVELTTMLIDNFAQSREMVGAEREKSLKEIENYYQRAYDRSRDAGFGEPSAVLKLRGKLELLQGGNDAPVKAIKSFEKAQAAYRVETNGREELDLMFLLARSYFASRQTGQAKQQLLKFMEKWRDYIPVRMMLAQVLVAEGDVVTAREHVEYLEKQAPDDPDVVRLVIAVLDQVKEKDRIKDCMTRLPESNRNERLLKAQIASGAPVNNPDEALRLYNAILKEEPGDFEALNAARELMVAKGKKDEALALLETGQKAAPDDRRIGLLIKQLKGATPEEIRDASEKLIREMYSSDPYQRELKLYEFFLVQNQKRDAYKHLLEAEAARPEDGRVMDLLFQYYAGEQNWDKAGQYVQKLADKNWDQAKGLIYRFRLAMIRNDVPGATAQAREMTQSFGEFARSWVFLGQALQAAGQFEQAVSNYSIALDKQGENPDALAGIIACYYQLNRPNDAFRYIEQATKSHPSNAFFREQLKAWHMNYGDPAKVLEQAKSDRDSNPEDLGRWISLGRVQYGAARKRDASSAQYLADAKATFEAAIKKWPAEKVLWAHLADIAEFARDFSAGETLLKDMASREQFKDSSEPSLMLADFYLRFGKADLAEATMKRAAERFKDDLDVRRRLAAYYTQGKRYDEALKLLDPSSPDKLVRQQIVEVLMLAGKFGEAEKLLRGLLQSSSKDAQLHALLGVVLLNQNRKQQALESMNTALELDPRNQAALYSRGQLRLKDNPPQLDEAIKDLMALRDINPQHVEARVSLAEAFRQRSQLDAASRELEDALRRVPTRDDIRISLAGIYATMKPASWTDVERLLREGQEREPKRALWKRMEAKMLSSRNQHEKAALTIRDAIMLASNDTERGDMARDYFDILETGKNWRQLQVECDQAFRASPQAAKEAWWIYVKRAIARRNMDLKREAMEDFQKAFEIAQEQGNPDVLFSIVDKIGQHMGKGPAIERATILAANKGPEASRWKVVLAYLYFTDNNPKKAGQLIEEARTEFPNMGPRDKQTTLTVAGTVYMMTGEFDKARTVYEQLLELKNDDLAALNNMACLMAEHIKPPNLQKAMEYSSRAYDLMTRRNLNEPNILDTHGWVHVLTGGSNVDKGIELLSNSIKASEIPESQYHLAEAFLLKKFPQEAKKSLVRAQELLQERVNNNQPFDPQLRQKIEEAMLKAEKAEAEARVTSP